MKKWGMNQSVRTQKRIRKSYIGVIKEGCSEAAEPKQEEVWEQENQRSSGGDIFREKEGENFSLPARSMTHLLPADTRMDGDEEEEEGDGQSPGERWRRRGESWRDRVRRGKEKEDSQERRGGEEWRRMKTGGVSTAVQKNKEADLKPTASPKLFQSNCVSLRVCDRDSTKWAVNLPSGSCVWQLAAERVCLWLIDRI